jgi:hypothetical protein
MIFRVLSSEIPAPKALFILFTSASHVAAGSGGCMVM